MAIEVVDSVSAVVVMPVFDKSVECISDFVKRQPKWVRVLWSVKPRRVGVKSSDDDIIMLTNVAV